MAKRRSVLKGFLVIAVLLLFGGSVACVGRGVSHKEGAPWHHTATGFRNLSGAPDYDASVPEMIAFGFGRLSEWGREVEVPEGHVIPPDQALADMRAALTADDNDSVTWIGHASHLVNLGGKNILTDPFFAEIASPSPAEALGLGPRRFVAPGIALSDLPQIDIIVASHNHYEHLGAASIEALPGKDKIHAVVPLGMGAFFRERGYSRVTELDWHEQVRDGRVVVTALPTIHFSARSIFDRNEVLWAGYALESGDQKVYFGGDSAYGPVFAENGKRHGPFDLALVAIGAYDPYSIMKASHTTPEDAVRLARDLRAQRVSAMHWGTLAITDEPPFEPPVRFRKAATDQGYGEDQTWVLAIGETRILPVD